jgi:hypothetical protein
MSSKEIWLDANHLTEDNESSESGATSEPPRKKKKIKLEAIHKHVCWKKSVCRPFSTSP